MNSVEVEMLTIEDLLEQYEANLLNSAWDPAGSRKIVHRANDTLATGLAALAGLPERFGGLRFSLRERTQNGARVAMVFCATSGGWCLTFEGGYLPDAPEVLRGGSLSFKRIRKKNDPPAPPKQSSFNTLHTRRGKLSGDETEHRVQLDCMQMLSCAIFAQPHNQKLSIFK